MLPTQRFFLPVHTLLFHPCNPLQLPSPRCIREEQANRRKVGRLLELVLKARSIVVVLSSRELLRRVSGGVVSYAIPESPTVELSDISYDGKRQDNSLTDGLGRLVDGEVGADNYRLDMGDGRGNRWVDTQRGAKCRKRKASRRR